MSFVVSTVYADFHPSVALSLNHILSLINIWHQLAPFVTLHLQMILLPANIFVFARSFRHDTISPLMLHEKDVNKTSASPFWRCNFCLIRRIQFQHLQTFIDRFNCIGVELLRMLVRKSNSNCN